MSYTKFDPKWDYNKIDEIINETVVTPELKKKELSYPNDVKLNLRWERRGQIIEQYKREGREQELYTKAYSYEITGIVGNDDAEFSDDDNLDIDDDTEDYSNLLTTLNLDASPMEAERPPSYTAAPEPDEPAEEEPAADEQTEDTANTPNLGQHEPDKPKSEHKQRQKRISVSQYDTIQNIPKGVISAMNRMLNPCGASRADVLSAFVYIFTNGDCKISDKAMEIVHAYQKTDELVNMNTRLKHIENVLRQHTDMLYSIELVSSFNTYDRRYGANRTKNPKDTDFCEPDNLAMIDKLRQQAHEQKQLENRQRGRDTWDEINHERETWDKMYDKNK